MCVDADEEKGSAVCVEVANKPSVVYIAADVCYGGKCSGNIRRVVYCEE